MLIQCQTCNAKYKLNLEKIPNRKTFIKCRQCNAPIYIDPQEEEPPESRVVDPGDGSLATHQTIFCPECNARYSVPTESLLRPGRVLKCTACSSKFPAPHVEIPVPQPDTVNEDKPFFPSAEPENSPSSGDTQMPLPDENRMDSLFDDLKVDSTTKSGNFGFPRADGSDSDQDVSPEQAYLDAISFQEGEGGYKPPEKGSVPENQKYRLFMKPKDPNDIEYPSSEKSEESTGNNAPDLEDLPPLDSAPSENVSSSGVSSNIDDLPPLDSVGSTSPSSDGDLMVQSEEPTFDHPNPPVQSQFGWEKFEKRNFFGTLIGAVVVLGISLGVWSWQSEQRGDATAFQLLPGQMSDFTAKVTRQGYFLTNKPTGEKLYILNGEITNNLPPDEKVSWALVEGLAFGNNGKVLGRETTYVGNIMSDKDLIRLDLEEIAAFHGFANGQKNANYQVSGGKPMPFQIVLRGVPEPVVRNETSVTRFSMGGRQIYLKSQP